MNEAIIKNWNSIIPADGIVFNLGDLGMNVNSFKHLLPKLNGTMYHIIGNHDNEKTINHLKSLNIKVADMATIVVNDEEIDGGAQTIALCHFQFSVWDQSHKGSWHLYGHEHSLVHKNTEAKLDVGVDGHDMKPWSYDDVKVQITKQLVNTKNEKNK